MTKLETYGGLAVIAACALLYVQHLRNTVASERGRADNAVAAQVQAEHTTKVVDHFHTETRIIHDRAEREADALQQLPGATDALDPGERDALCAAIDRVRNDGKSACADPGQPPRAVPAGDSGSAADEG